MMAAVVLAYFMRGLVRGHRRRRALDRVGRLALPPGADHRRCPHCGNVREVYMHEFGSRVHTVCSGRSEWNGRDRCWTMGVALG